MAHPLTTIYVQGYRTVQNLIWPCDEIPRGKSKVPRLQGETFLAFGAASGKSEKQQSYHTWIEDAQLYRAALRGQETERQVFSPQSSSAGFSFTESAVVAPIAYVASLALSAVVMVRVPAVRLAIDALTSPVPPIGADSRSGGKTIKTPGPKPSSRARRTCRLSKTLYWSRCEATSAISPRMKANTVHRVLDGLTPYEWARVTSAGSRGASGWLMATPSEGGGQPLSSEQFVISM